MNREKVSEITKEFEAKSTEELKDLYFQHAVHSDEGLEALQAVLNSRGVWNENACKQKPQRRPLMTSDGAFKFWLGFGVFAFFLFNIAMLFGSQLDSLFESRKPSAIVLPNGGGIIFAPRSPTQRTEHGLSHFWERMNGRMPLPGTNVGISPWIPYLALNGMIIVFIVEMYQRRRKYQDEAKQGIY